MTDEYNELLQLVRPLVDRAHISDLIDRFARDLDDITAAGGAFDLDWAREYFTDDASVDYPVGSAEGAVAVAELIDQRGMSRFERTHHVTSNHIIELTGEHASARFNLIATHLYPRHPRPQRAQDSPQAFTVGDYYETELVHTHTGWRFRRQVLHVVWTEGTPPA